MTTVSRLFLPLIPCLLVAGLPRSAGAAFPEDIDVGGLDGLDAPTQQRMFDYVVREMAGVISPKALSTASTLGTFGFEIGIENTLAFPHTTTEADTNLPTWDIYTAWDLMTASGEPNPGVIYMPQIRLRKGLPYSFEVGTTLGWMLNTRQTVLGVFGRWAPQEGWRNVPDIGLAWAYNGLVGNETLDMGVFEFDLTVGYTFTFGIDRKYTSARFAPFAGLGFLTTHAKAKNIEFDLLPATGWANKAEPGVSAADFRFTKVVIGFSLVNNHFQFAFDGELIPRGVHAINMRIGLDY